MTKQEKLSMIKSAIVALAQNPALDANAKKRGIKSLKAAYHKYANAGQKA